MKTFIIDTENNIVFDPAAVSAIALEAGSETFRTKEALMALAAEWPASRLVEIWNSFTGVRPVQRFMNRNTGVTRIWEYIQRLTVEAASERAESLRHAEATEQVEHATEREAAAAAGDTDLTERRASMKQARSADRKKRKAAKAEKAAAVPAAVGAAVQKAVRAGKSPKEVVKAAEKAIESGPLAKAGSKGAIILELIGRRNGATLAELMTATDWQKHSVRGFIAGNAKTKLGLNVISTKDDDGSRRYALGA